MTKRICIVLLAICLVVGLLPTTATAATTQRTAIQLVDATKNPTGGIVDWSSTGGYDYIYMGYWTAPDAYTTSGPIKWRVLDDQTNTGATGLFLLSEEVFGGLNKAPSFFDSYPYSNVWQGSSLQKWCKDFAGEAGAQSNVTNAFSVDELGAILATSKSDDEFATGVTLNQDDGEVQYTASDNILNGDKVFCLSGEEASNSEYGFTDNDSRIAYYKGSSNTYEWYLRSTSTKNQYAGMIVGDGQMSHSYVLIRRPARPAFNLDMSKVLFTSEANTIYGSTVSSIGQTTSNEWKLTLLDSDRSSFAVSTTSVESFPGGTFSIDYSNAETGDNNGVSVIIKQGNDLLYSGWVSVKTAAGSATFTLPDNIPAGEYTVEVYSEENNGAKKTNYAYKAEREVTLNVGYKITFEPNGGTNPDGLIEGTYLLTDTSGKLSAVPGEPTWANYQFDGWYSAQTGGEKITITADYEFNGNTIVYAHWTPTYPVTVTNGSGSGYYAAGASVTIAANAASPGHSFIGWTDADDLTFASGSSASTATATFTMPARAVNVTATYTVNEYTITFNTDGGSPVSSITQNYGTVVTAPANPTKQGYWFNSWSPAVPDNMPATDMTITATWNPINYTITYYIDNEQQTGLEPTTYNYAQGTVSLPTPPEKQGYDFDGWYPDNTYNSTSKVEQIGPTEPDNRTFYGKWVARSDTSYTVEYYMMDTNGSYPTTATRTETTTGTTDTTATANTTPPTWFAFDSGKTGTQYTGTITADGLLVLKVYFSRNQYALTFDPNGGNWNGETASKVSTKYYGETISAPANPDRDYYDFTAWSPAVEATMPAADTTYTAQWGTEEYTITYKGLDLTGVTAPTPSNPTTYNYESNEITLNNPTRTGYTFTGWTGTGIVDGPKTEVRIPTGSHGNREYTATWTANTYDAVFNANGGVWVMPDDEQITQITVPTVFDEAIVTPEDPKRAGYDFTGWNPAVGTMNSEAGLNFTAQWQQNTTATAYVVRHWFEALDGTFPVSDCRTEDKTITDNDQTAAAPYSPVPEGFTLRGQPTQVPIAPDGSTEVDIYYTRNSYNLTFDANGGAWEGGDTTKVISHKYEQTIAKPNDNPVRDGYTFMAWEPDTPVTSRAFVPPTLPQTMPARDVTWKAIWLSDDAALQSVSVSGIGGTVTGTSAVVLLPNGYEIPTDPASVSLTPVHPGATVSNLTTTDGGYTWTFTITAADEQTSAHFVLNVYRPPVFIIPDAPVEENRLPGETVTMTAEATENPEYRWQVDRGLGAGWEELYATGPSYTTSELSTQNSGWQFRCVATNPAGEAYSHPFTLFVMNPLPATGDDSHIGLWLALAGLGGAGMLAIILQGRKKKTE